MKIVAVYDHFVREEDCVRGFSRFPDAELKLIHYGYEDRQMMRDIFQRVEHGGPDAYPAPDEVYTEIEDADVLMVHICPVPAKLIARGKKLKAILVNRGGLENIDLAAATARGIAVFNNPAHNANAVAEFVVGVMLAETRNIVRSNLGLLRGEWLENYPNTGRIRELKGSTVGIIGFSNIGRLVAKKLNAFGCNFLINDIRIDPDDEELRALPARVTDLPTLMKESDIVTLHARAPKVILTAEMLQLMKPSAYFINTARANMVDYDALRKLLIERKIQGAALDVYPIEPPQPDDPLLTLDNVTLTTHRGGDTKNAYSDSPDMMVENYANFLAGKKARFLVNPEYKDHQ